MVENHDHPKMLLDPAALPQHSDIITYYFFVLYCTA